MKPKNHFKKWTKEEEKIWQVGSGDKTRDYSRFCLDYGIAIVGPEDPWGNNLKKIHVGEIVLLRRGKTKIIAVGIVRKSHDTSESLNDVHGWGLNHFITLKWYVNKDKPYIKLPSALIGYSTMSCIDKNRNKIKEIINNTNLVEYNSQKKISNLKIPKKITENDIQNHLINAGIRISDAQNITNTIARIITLVEWYIKNDPDVLELELRTFLVIPFLLSLGWSEQKIKIEYNNIDIALFSKPFQKKSKSQPQIIIETKSFSDGLSLAKEQSEKYAKNYPDCKKMITTNGFRYSTFEKDRDIFKQTSYINLLDLREFDYINNDIGGALKSLLLISNFK